jgi:hypothetical protein
LVPKYRSVVCTEAVPQEQLDLLKFPPGGPAHFRARAPEVVRGDAWKADCGRMLLEQLPNDLLAQRHRPNPTAAVHGTKYRPVDHPSCLT